MRIEEFKQVNKGALKATFNVIIPEWGMTIRSCSFFEQNGKSWIGYPCRAYDDPTSGKKKFFSFILFDEKVKPRIEKAIREELSKFLKVEEERAMEFDEDLPF